jgi:endonuclease YncB( thermonuclease family)
LIHGNVFISKKNVACLLLEAGLAHVHTVGKAQVKYIDFYRTVEGAAKADRKGIWSGSV